MTLKPTIKHCESVEFIGKEFETEFSKLQEIASSAFEYIAQNSSLKGKLITPFIRYINTDSMIEGKISVIAGYLLEEHVDPQLGLISGILPSGRYVVQMVVGPYDQLLEVNKRIQEWVRSEGLEFKKAPVAEGSDWVSRYELYLIGQESEPDPERWKTEIRYLVA